MKAKRNIILTTALFSAAALPALAAEPETTDKEVAAAEEVKAEAQPKIKQTNYTDDYEKFRFGGYGEMERTVFRVRTTVIHVNTEAR